MELLDRIEQICLDMETELYICKGVVSEDLVRKTEELLTLISIEPVEIKKVVEESMYKMIKKSHYHTKVWLYSAIVTLTYHPKLMEEFLKYCIEEDFSPNTKYFLLNQIKSILFKHTFVDNGNIKYLRWQLLEQSVRGLKKELEDLLVPIPYEKRNQDKAFVIVQQILTEEHAPTKTALDRCKILMEHMNKKVLLINTAEFMPSVGEIPYYNMQAASYILSLTEWEALGWKGAVIPYFQCNQNMPDIETLRLLLQMVQNQKPGLVIEIGGESMFASLVDDLIPVLTIGTVPSDWDGIMTRCQTISRELTNVDTELLQKMGKGEQSIIQSIFTSSLQPQRKKVTRKELGLPENKFILVVIGVRLDEEIEDYFMDMIAQALDKDMAVAIIGKFELCERYIQKIPGLNGKMYNLGHSSDILSWIEVCDLYVNPYRKGGGTSCVEALYKGLPVVTLPYGDVSVNAGEEFFTESYDTMVELIRKYKNDLQFYHAMSERAKERAGKLLDSASEFQNIIKEFEQRFVKF